MGESNLPFEEREELLTVLSNAVSYELLGSSGQMNATPKEKNKCDAIARAVLDTLEDGYALELKEE